MNTQASAWVKGSLLVLASKSGLRDDKRDQEILANHSATDYSIQVQDSNPEEEDCEARPVGYAAWDRTWKALKWIDQENSQFSIYIYAIKEYF